MTYIEDLLHDRYYQPGESSWADLTDRVIGYVYEGAGDREREDAHKALLNREFIPSSPVLMNAGTRYPMMCSCFVLPVHDNIQSIMETLSNTVFIQKFGGGVGINFSEIRPDGSIIESTNGIASGPVSFMGFWNEAMNVIRQGGKRQGAMMGILGVDHPDLPLFLDAKRKEGKLTNFNLSVMLPGEFWERDLDVRDAQLYEIAEHTWVNGEPGVLFRDNINKENPYGDLEINATNPCGELPLPPYGACCLGSINLMAALEYNRARNKYMVNPGKLRDLAYIGVRFLNRVLDQTWWPIDEIAAFEDRYRPIGLGVMGLADMLASLKIPYGSSKAQAYVRHLMSGIRYLAEQASEQYAEQHGTPNNATLLSIAPTGSISMLAGCSYSIEPYFTFTGQKHVEAGEFDIDSSIVERVAHLFGEELTEGDWATIAETGSVADTGLSDDAKHVLRTANEIPWQEHIRMQAAVQHYVDSAVSKTINMPQSATVDDVVHAITMAWVNGCKGLTIYRNGSREDEVITGTGDGEDEGPTVNEDGFLECEVCEI